MVCQYESDGEGTKSTGLRAVSQLDADQSLRALQAIQAAPVMHPQPCETPVSRELVLVLHIPSDGGQRRLVVQAGTCADGNTAMGGFDDGSQVRVLTRNACQPLMQPPIALQTAGRYVGGACLG